MNQPLVKQIETRFGDMLRCASVVFLSATLLGCQPKNNATEVSVAPLRPVKVMEAAGNGSAMQRVLAATVISADSQNLSFRVSGSITSLPVDVGDVLTAGSLVAELDRKPFELGLREAWASLSQAKANERNAASQYRRMRELYANEAASLSDLENAKTNASSASANSTLAQQRLSSAALNNEYSKLKSPSTVCQVVSVPVAVNQNVTAGQTIATTACGDQLRLRTLVPESLINKIEVGMPVDATLQTGNISLSGDIVEIGVSNNSGGYAVEVELESPPPSIKVGMAAQVTLSLGGSDERLLVPLIAVQSDSAGKFVYVATALEDHYVIERQSVQTGELGNNGIEIVEGIEPGEQVVVAGMSRVSEGMKVSLYNSIQP